MVMKKNFRPACLSALIGSLPLSDHEEAADWVLDHTPEIPLWVQLPVHPQEGMVPQFVPGMPGLTGSGDRIFVDTGSPGFDDELVAFYEDYLDVTEGGKPLDDSRFALSRDMAPGFHIFLERLAGKPTGLRAVKGQVTGPFTLATSLTDQDGRAVFYDERLLDAVVKLVAMKARWQAEKLSAFGVPAMVFLDEPGLAGFGSSTFLGISKEAAAGCLSEAMEAIQAAGALAGVHICANADWSLALESPANVVSFDAYSFFDRFILYGDLIRRFISNGNILAWGIIPTSDLDKIRAETAGSLESLFWEHIEKVVNLGIPKEQVLAQSLITPACGTGSLSPELAKKVLALTRDLSARVRNRT